MKQIKLIFLMVSVFLLLINLVSANYPEVHVYIQHKSFVPNSPVGSIVQNNWCDYISGQLLSDSGIFYYIDPKGGIGVEYKIFHSTTFTKRCVEMSSNNEELSWCYGFGSHQISDSIAHNEFVPTNLKSFYGQNGIFHAFIEDAQNRKIKTKELTSEIKSCLENTAPKHRAFFIKVAETQEGLSKINTGNLYDTFIQQLSGSGNLSFKGFTAIPFSIHFILILFFLANMLLLAYLIRKKDKSKFNYISMFIVLILAILVILIYILFFTGKIWQAFQFISIPVSWIIPNSGWDSSIQKEIQMNIQYMNQGVTYLNNIKDPAGSEALRFADASGNGVRIIIYFILMALIILFIWLNFRKKR